MNNPEGLQPLNHSLSGLPQWVSERILQQINRLTHYEPVIGIMGKTGAGKSSLCNALFVGEISPVSDVAACTREPLRFRLQVGERYMTLVDLTREELFRVVPSVFSEDKHESRSERYTYIPTISLLDSLQREGFQPFFACQTRVRDPGRREHTKHLLRLRREGQITGKQVPEIILLNSHDGTSSYQMLPGLFRAVCQNGLVCGESFGEVRVPHKGDVVSQVIEGAYEVLGIFDRVEEKRDAMQSLLLPPPAQQALAKAALTYRFGEDHQPVTESQILSPRRWQDESSDLWTTYQRIQENLIKGGLSGRNAKGGRSHTRAVRGIDGDVKLNRALWVMEEAMLTQLQ